MKKRILCYGDSNTWGYISGTDHQRYGENERWTRLLGNLLGNEYEIIEEGLNSRTLISNDLRPGREGRNGYEYLMPCLDSHDPLDLVVLMLGTNELKTMFNKSIEEVGSLLEEYFVKTIINRKSQINGECYKLLIVAPPIAKDDGSGKYAGAYEKSLRFNEVYSDIANRNNCYFVDNSLLDVGIDGVHLTKESHKILADKLYNVIKDIK